MPQAPFWCPKRARPRNASVSPSVLVSASRLTQRKHRLQGRVNVKLGSQRQSPDPLTESLGIHGGGLLDEYEGGLPVNVDLRSEARRPSGRRGGCHQPGGQRQVVKLDNHALPPLLLVTPSVPG
jgi:hypothetical protein